jgi:DNA repair protein RadC
MSLSQWPVGEAPREKLLLRGSHALSDAELLALLLGTGSSGRSVLNLARDLLDRFGGLVGVLNANCRELCAESGIGPAKYVCLQASLELAQRHAREGLERGDTMSSPDQTRQFLSMHLRRSRREIFCCLFLDSQNALIRCEDLFQGTLDGAAVYPREVVNRALQLNAAAVILAHNHPSGVAEPSQADRRITERLQAALALLDIRVLDHIIVGAGQQFSFAERGLL